MKPIMACVVGLGLLCLFSEVNAEQNDGNTLNNTVATDPKQQQPPEQVKYLNQNWNPRVTDKVFFDVTQKNVFLGRIVFGLFGEIVPKTVANFIALAEGVNETTASGDVILRTYKGNKFHRVINGFVVQGGDITYGDGTGGWSIYGRYFPDENFILNHYGAGWVNMANAGKDTNESQFAILTRYTPWLNGHHIVFAVVLEGMAVVDWIQTTKTSTGDVPVEDIFISDCGTIPVATPFGVDRATRGFPEPRPQKQ